jgi:hypothetical protein
MRFIRNEKGIALVLVLILALISLAVVSAMLFMITQGTQMSGGLRFFRTAEEAGLGGTEITTEFIASNVAKAVNAEAWESTVTTALGATLSTTACLQQKLSLTKSAWTACTAPALTMDATVSPDLRFDLGNYRVFGKIVDTVQGNSDTLGGATGGGTLGGSGSIGGIPTVTPVLRPYLYTIEVHSRDITDVAGQRERSLMSILYAY